MVLVKGSEKIFQLKAQNKKWNTVFWFFAAEGNEWLIASFCWHFKMKIPGMTRRKDSESFVCTGPVRVRGSHRESVLHTRACLFAQQSPWATRLNHITCLPWLLLDCIEILLCFLPSSTQRKTHPNKKKNRTVTALRLRTRKLPVLSLVKENYLIKSNIMFVLYSGDYLTAV